MTIHVDYVVGIFIKMLLNLMRSRRNVYAVVKFIKIINHVHLNTSTQSNSSIPKNHQQGIHQQTNLQLVPLSSTNVNLPTIVSIAKSRTVLYVIKNIKWLKMLNQCIVIPVTKYGRSSHQNVKKIQPKLFANHVRQRQNHHLALIKQNQIFQKQHQHQVQYIHQHLYNLQSHKNLHQNHPRMKKNLIKLIFHFPPSRGLFLTQILTKIFYHEFQVTLIEMYWNVLMLHYHSVIPTSHLHSFLLMK